MAGLAPFDLLVIAMATLYLSFALTKTKGPFGIFETIRTKAPLGGLTTCISCAAFWIGLVFYWLWLIQFQWIAYPFAVAGIAVALAYYVGLAQQ